jgi:hypothetical protein
MMMETLSDAAQAARLLMLAMGPATTPANNDEYGHLTGRYLSESGFRGVVEDIAEAMELTVIAESPQYGIVLGSEPGGFFAPRLDDFRRGMSSVKERTAYGLLHFMLVGYVYPSAERLGEEEDTLSHKIRVGDLVRYTRETCDSLKAAGTLKDVATEEAMEGFNHLLSSPEQEGQASLRARIRFVLEKYAKEGLLQESDEAGEKIYRARPQFRIQARRMISGAHEALMQRIREAREAAAQGEKNHG